MIKVLSKQVNVPFVYCPSPIVIDKRDDWGPSEDNYQRAPKGAYLKMSDDITVSHLVQPNEDNSAPIGWEVTPYPGLFTKSPIFITEEVLDAGITVHISTLDGPIQYEVKEPSMICFNQTKVGDINYADSWVQSMKNLEKNYFL